VTQQYIRKISLVVGDPGGPALDFADFRCTFRVQRGDLQTPNTADVRIYNLSDNTAHRIQDEFTQIVLQAGYEGSYGLIFQGVIKQVRKGRADAKDTYVDITAADGDEPYNFAPMALTLAAGSKVVDGVQGAIQAMTQGALSATFQQKITAGQLPKLPDNGRVRGQVYYGMARDVLRDLARAYGFSWSIQDGRLQFIPLGGYLPGAVPVISPNTGLIGVPEQIQEGISLRVLLNPNIKVGQLIKLDSTAINLLRYGLDTESQALTNAQIERQAKTNADGLYYCMVVDHIGDTRGNEWFTDVVGLAVDATIVGSQVPGQTGEIPENAIIRR
jgi:hypothetical protein